MTRIVVTEEFSVWARGLERDTRKALVRAVGLLEVKGIALGYPYSSALKNSKIGLRELRIQAQGVPLRIFYAFDFKRRAVLLLGGNKAGEKRFYERLIPKAERIWRSYLEDIHDAEEETKNP